MTYLAHPTHYAPDEFRTLVRGLKFDKGWTPQFPTLHNTGVPSLKDWLGWGAVPQERWGSNPNAYYRGKGWHSAVHLVACPDYIWHLCDLEYDGVSVSCWNRVTLGIEMVGNYEVGGDDFASGPGARVRDNAVFVLAALCERFGWAIGDVLHFHRECAQDRHACPGSRVSKPEIIQRVNALMEQWGAKPAPIASAAPPAASAPSPALPDLSTMKGVQEALNALGFRVVETGAADAQTSAAVFAFQRFVKIATDGIVGPQTRAALGRELSKLAKG